jgi:hypothetical protein
MVGNVAAIALSARLGDTADAGGAPERMSMIAQLSTSGGSVVKPIGADNVFPAIRSSESGEGPTIRGDAKDLSRARNRAETDGGRLDEGACALGGTCTSP